MLPEAKVPPLEKKKLETILVVEDSEILRTFIVAILDRADFNVISADSGPHAIELAETMEGRIDLLLTDWDMPEMSGIDFLIRLRADRNQVPFGFITSETSKGIRELAMSSGATFLISKPFTPEDVQNALIPVLGRC